VPHPAHTRRALPLPVKASVTARPTRTKQDLWQRPSTRYPSYPSPNCTLTDGYRHVRPAKAGFSAAPLHALPVVPLPHLLLADGYRHARPAKAGFSAAPLRALPVVPLPHLLLADGYRHARPAKAGFIAAPLHALPVMPFPHLHIADGYWHARPAKAGFITRRPSRVVSSRPSCDRSPTTQWVGVQSAPLIQWCRVR